MATSHLNEIKKTERKSNVGRQNDLFQWETETLVNSKVYSKHLNGRVNWLQFIVTSHLNYINKTERESDVGRQNDLFQ